MLSNPTIKWFLIPYILPQAANNTQRKNNESKDEYFEPKSFQLVYYSAAQGVKTRRGKKPKKLTIKPQKNGKGMHSVEPERH